MKFPEAILPTSSLEHFGENDLSAIKLNIREILKMRILFKLLDKGEIAMGSNVWILGFVKDPILKQRFDFVLSSFDSKI